MSRLIATPTNTMPIQVGCESLGRQDAVDAVVLMDIGRQTARTFAANLPRSSHHNQRRSTAQYYSGHGTDLVVYSGCYRTVGEGNFDKLVNIGKGAALMTGTTMENGTVRGGLADLGQ